MLLLHYLQNQGKIILFTALLSTQLVVANPHRVCLSLFGEAYLRLSQNGRETLQAACSNDANRIECMADFLNVLRSCEEVFSQINIDNERRRLGPALLDLRHLKPFPSHHSTERLTITELRECVNRSRLYNKSLRTCLVSRLHGIVSSY